MSTPANIANILPWALQMGDWAKVLNLALELIEQATDHLVSDSGGADASNGFFFEKRISEVTPRNKALMHTVLEDALDSVNELLTSESLSLTQKELLKRNIALLATSILLGLTGVQENEKPRNPKTLH